VSACRLPILSDMLDVNEYSAVLLHRRF